jgi:hypothetical protein
VRRPLDARVVDQEVDGPELRARVGDHLLERPEVGHVGRKRGDRGALARQALAHLLERALAPRDEHEAHPALGKGFGDADPDAA